MCVCLFVLSCMCLLCVCLGKQNEHVSDNTYYTGDGPIYNKFLSHYLHTVVHCFTSYPLSVQSITIDCCTGV